MKGLRRTGRIFGGVFDDYQRRARHCLSDYTDGWHSKTISAAIFMFFATFSSTVALGELARRQTNGHIGVTEYLLLQSGAGLLHALFSSQPLLILRPTGPITVFVVELYTLSQKVKQQPLSPGCVRQQQAKEEDSLRCVNYIWRILMTFLTGPLHVQCLVRNRLFCMAGLGWHLGWRLHGYYLSFRWFALYILPDAFLARPIFHVCLHHLHRGRHFWHGGPF